MSDKSFFTPIKQFQTWFVWFKEIRFVLLSKKICPIKRNKICSPMKTIPNCVIMQQLSIPSRYNNEKRENLLCGQNVFGAKWAKHLEFFSHEDNLVDGAMTLVVFLTSEPSFVSLEFPSGQSQDAFLPDNVSSNLWHFQKLSSVLVSSMFSSSSNYIFCISVEAFSFQSWKRGHLIFIGPR